jgi:hypothetical protein
MTTTQRDAITSPATGLKIYNTTLGTTDTYDGATWQRFGQQTLIKGSGSTSATTSLLVQNSAGTAALTVKDDLSAAFNVSSGVLTLQHSIISSSSRLEIAAYDSSTYGVIVQSRTSTQWGNASFVFMGFTSSMECGSAHISTNATGANASAMLDVTSTTKGFLPPRMTTTQKNAIATPAAGLQVFDTTFNQMSYFNGSVWINF